MMMEETQQVDDEGVAKVEPQDVGDLEIAQATYRDALNHLIRRLERNAGDLVELVETGWNLLDAIDQSEAVL